MRQILRTRLPEPPAIVLDIGGGAGVHALWLAKHGYEVHLVEPVPVHVEQAQAASDAQPDAPLASVQLGDARTLPFADQSADCVLLFGPLYHLAERSDRLAALDEAHRVLRPDGHLAAIGISRYAFLLDGIATERVFTTPGRLEMIASSVETGAVGEPFTTAHLHRPDELTAEVREAGFEVDELLGVEGPGWLLARFNRAWEDEAQRETLLKLAELVETERDLVAASTHLLVIARRL